MIPYFHGSHLFCLKDNKLLNIQNFLLTPIKVSSGVPQEDHVSPLLFLLFINDILSVLKHSKMLLLADDNKIYITVTSINDTLKLQSDFNYFCKWCLNNGMKLNLNKCSIITFSYKKKYF